MSNLFVLDVHFPPLEEDRGAVQVRNLVAVQVGASENQRSHLHVFTLSPPVENGSHRRRLQVGTSGLNWHPTRPFLTAVEGVPVNQRLQLAEPALSIGTIPNIFSTFENKWLRCS